MEEKLCTIVFDDDFTFYDEDGTRLNCRLDFVTDEMEEAIVRMDCFYDSLDFKGYFDEAMGAFIVVEVINNFDNTTLSSEEINEMIYIAGNPACVKLKDPKTGVVLGIEL